jgi:hypothetical protein
MDPPPPPDGQRVPRQCWDSGPCVRCRWFCTHTLSFCVYTPLMPKTPKQRVPLRLDAGLAAWADEYAEARGSSRTAVYEAALSTLRDLASGGVPELESAASEAKGPSRSEQAGPRVPSSPGREGVRPAPPTRASGASASAGRVARPSGSPSAGRRVVEPSSAGVVDDVVPAAVPASVLSRAERFRRATQGG